MRVLVHDHSGHPFQVQLSRELARRGHTVLHLQNPAFQTGKGALSRQDGDPAGFEVEAITVGTTFEKYSIVNRHRHERRYGQLLVRRARRFRPDIMVSTNEPLLVATIANRYRHHDRVPSVFWLQDFYSLAMAHAAQRRIPRLARPAGAAFAAVERRVVRQADQIVAISADFLPTLARWGIEPAKCTVVENWAPIDELPQLPKRNPWSTAQGLADARVVLYSGTLGLKHDPSLLLSLARRFAATGDVQIVVVSEGLGADWLREKCAELGLSNLRILNYQPFDQFPQVLASADVLVTLLEPQAGTFSVPSKVLSYYCAGRPVLAAIPEENLAARTIVEHGAGLVVPPGDHAAFVDAAARLLDDEVLCKELGNGARIYAETHFAIKDIANQFERTLERACTPVQNRAPVKARQYLSGRSAS